MTSSGSVVCLHGLGRTPADWDSVAAGLGRYGTVVAPQLPRDPAAALEVADRAIPDDAIVVGHSLGAVLALRLVGEQRRAVRAVVLSSSFFPPARNGRTLPASLLDYGRHRVALVRELRARGRSLQPRASTGGALASLARIALRRRDFDAWAAAMDVPVVVVHARDDHYVPIDFALAAAAAHPAWSLSVLDRGGHYPQVESPTAWLAAIAAFNDAQR